MKNKVLIFLAIIMSFSALAYAYDPLTDLMKNRKSIRGTALGDAVVSCSDGLDGIMYNPAFLRSSKLRYGSEELDYKNSDYYCNNTQLLVINNMGYGVETKKSAAASIWIRSFGLAVAGQKNVSWGLKYKNIEYRTPQKNIRGYTIDFGLDAVLARNISMGLMAKDIYKNNIPVPTTLSLGWCFDIQSLSIMPEIEYNRSVDKVANKIGMEMELDKTLTLRVGLNGNSLSAGGSFVLPFVHFEYAIISNTGPARETIHQLGFHLGE